MRGRTGAKDRGKERERENAAGCRLPATTLGFWEEARQGLWLGGCGGCPGWARARVRMERCATTLLLKWIFQDVKV